MSKEMIELDDLTAALDRVIGHDAKGLTYDTLEQLLSSAAHAAKDLRAALHASAVAEPVGYGYSAEIQSAPGRLLHVCRDREGLYDTPLYTHPAPAAPVPASVREALKNLTDAAKLMPHATPKPGGAGTIHDYKIEAAYVWALDRAIAASETALASLPAPEAAPSNAPYYHAWLEVIDLCNKIGKPS